MFKSPRVLQHSIRFHEGRAQKSCRMSLAHKQPVARPERDVAVNVAVSLQEPDHSAVLLRIASIELDHEKLDTHASEVERLHDFKPAPRRKLSSSTNVQALMGEWASLQGSGAACVLTPLPLRPARRDRRASSSVHPHRRPGAVIVVYTRS